MKIKTKKCGEKLDPSTWARGSAPSQAALESITKHLAWRFHEWPDQFCQLGLCFLTDTHIQMCVRISLAAAEQITCNEKEDNLNCL